MRHGPARNAQVAVAAEAVGTVVAVAGADAAVAKATAIATADSIGRSGPKARLKETFRD